MKFLLVACLLVMGSFSSRAEDKAEEKSEITKLELLDLGAGESDVDTGNSEVQQKRDSGYSYKRPSGFSAASRSRFQQPAHAGRIVNRHPAQINRPANKYGPPGYQSSSPSRPAQHVQQHRDKLQHNGHRGHQHSSNFDGRPSGYLQQEVPSPIRQVDFVEPNPIASQNNEPFASHAANYLPPRNQKLPDYTPPQTFSFTQAAQNLQNQAQPANFQGQNLLQSPEQISDAALFLSQNAQAIQQLYGAPATQQDFAPNDDQFSGPNNQVQQAPFQNLESSSQTPQGFQGNLPSYASGTLSAQETLEQIQSLEKDRLIVQLQRALATQAQTSEPAGRYAQNQPSFVQNQDLLASLGQRTKIHGFDAQPGAVALGNTAFNRSPFLPGTSIAPGLPLNYGLLSTTALPPTTTATTTTTTTPVQPPQAAKADGSSQLGSTLPPLSLPPSTAGLPVYGGFVPTLITGTGFLSNVPSYGPGFFAPGTVTPVQTSGSAPTHFGIPIPTDQKPTTVNTPSSTPSTTLSGASTPSSPPVNTLPVQPVPVNPVATLPVQPVATHPVATHPVATHPPVVTPLQPVTPLRPVLPPTHVHPQQTPSAYPTYGLQTSVVNPFLYKPVKPVYPFYYYPNVAYQLQKPASPTYPWSYAPTYATQAKPAQIWK
ncbi:uncharacterized protein LOC143149492 [Ptiloglossa arizonensis]|uniref:uncharacterized protein LOC143149492 n=1 Tax=Ptiloglossa arizonensis TaxID=3350558 RepID=UPI003FA152B5